MFDLKLIRDNPAAFDQGLARRGLPALSGKVLELDQQRRSAQTALQEKQARRNEASKQIGMVKKQGGDAQALMDEVASLKDEMAALEVQERDAGAEIDRLLSTLPNAPAADVPEGPDEEHNVELRRWGTPRQFDFTPKEHDALGDGLGLMSFDDAAKISGARFVVLKGGLARLQRALGAFMLDIQTGEHGYTEVDPPILVRDKALYGTGQLPKFEEDLFKTAGSDAAAHAKIARHLAEAHANGETPAIGDLIAEYGEELASSSADRFWLIPTAEVPLTNLVADTILDDKQLPRRYTALTPCFRSEAGAAGKDTRGMIRQHQFWKVELVSVAHPDQSNEEHERMTKCAETILQRLGLPYRVIVLCTGDMGFSAQKTFDIEVWLPGQNRYREISSCSNCGDFQARRMGARFRAAGEKGTRFAHTLNGSGLAVGRTMVAVLENYQQADGSIIVPEALRPYMGGMDVLRPDV